ncbi:bifunctional 2-polyprenyl-6-hydroxyphenol methylase/3-demethylubiquinol 3-O-methyltransferase UbiG [Fodinicurvata sp. EGI_FJ10296]|uniref:bifunctional 2-polyprenyl-6-hydroxyphenol methylase/3-demethylubiquinol 3-O-methyltransferase UbiG n=1 Tax=Fodinicurvata sp. EGI_FJ10296 TaxID=3231908 RepID=UPI003452EA47
MSSDRPHRTRSAPPLHGAVDKDEIDRFDRIAAEWWDPRGKFRPLHAMNPTRAAYVRDRLSPLSPEGAEPGVAQPLSGLRLLDVGCGGGLLAECLARWGADVVAIDAGTEAIAVARRHAQDQGLAIDYRCLTADVLAEEDGNFDGVTALEVIEHVPDPARFCNELASLVRPGGRVVMSTLNRTRTSFLTAIVGAEYALGWLPRGTHDWNRFLKPSELAAMLRRSGLVVEDTAGLRPDTPTGRQWRLSRSSMSVNYLISAARPD